jgi:hypothetical protein
MPLLGLFFMKTNMTTVKNINANGTMSNLVGLWAVIRDEQGKIRHRVFIYGKADENHFLVQAVSALTGEPNVIRIAKLQDMVDWVFYDNPELLADECQREFEQGSVRYKFELSYPNVEDHLCRKAGNRCAEKKEKL